MNLVVIVNNGQIIQRRLQRRALKKDRNAMLSYVDRYILRNTSAQCADVFVNNDKIGTIDYRNMLLGMHRVLEVCE